MDWKQLLRNCTVKPRRRDQVLKPRFVFMELSAGWVADIEASQPALCWIRQWHTSWPKVCGRLNITTTQYVILKVQSSICCFGFQALKKLVLGLPYSQSLQFIQEVMDGVWRGGIIYNNTIRLSPRCLYCINEKSSVQVVSSLLRSNNTCIPDLDRNDCSIFLAAAVFLFQIFHSAATKRNVEVLYWCPSLGAHS